MRSQPLPEIARADWVVLWWIEGGLALTFGGPTAGVMLLNDALEVQWVQALQAPYDVVANADRLWVSDLFAGDVVEIDRNTGEISHRFARLSDTGPKYLTGRLLASEGILVCAGTEIAPNSKGLVDRTAAAFDIETGDLLWEFQPGYDAAWPLFAAARALADGQVALLDTLGRDFVLDIRTGAKRAFVLLDGLGAGPKITDVMGSGWPLLAEIDGGWRAFSPQGRELGRWAAGAVVAPDRRGAWVPGTRGWQVTLHQSVHWIAANRLPEGQLSLGPGGERLVVWCADGVLRGFAVADLVTSL